ncbi:hypothetical protein B5C26_17800 [Photorhabdus luminescens]|nr:hypothetical protein B5C26_17800 [Photorhabdus luminescens]
MRKAHYIWPVQKGIYQDKCWSIGEMVLNPAGIILFIEEVIPIGPSVLNSFPYIIISTCNVIVFY